MFKASLWPVPFCIYFLFILFFISGFVAKLSLSNSPFTLCIFPQLAFFFFHHNNEIELPGSSVLCSLFGVAFVCSFV